MANFNLKSIFTADTSDLKKGAAEAKQAVKDFDDATESALNEVVGLFGTSMGNISKTLSSVKGGYLQLSGALKTTTATAGLTSKAMNVLKIALMSTGIGALVVALGSLIAYFTKTQRGSDTLAKWMDQLGQVVKTVTDYFIKLGEKIVTAFTNPKKAIKDLWNLITNKEARAELAQSAKDAAKDFVDRQNRRFALTEKQQKLERDLIDYTVEKATLEKQIEQQREIAADKANKTAAERLAANRKAQELTAKLFEREKHFAQERLDIMIEENALSESMNKDLQAEADLKADLISLEGQRASKTKELLAQQAELVNQVKKEREEQDKIAQMKALRAANAANLLPAVDGSKALKGLQVTTELTPEFNPKKLETGVKEAEGYLLDFGKIASDFSNNISDAFSTMIESLVAGNFSLQDVFGMILSFLADSLKNIGKALIAYGTAMEAFKKAFSNPWAAIAAGAALVAAGAVLKGLIGKMSSGGGGTASPSAAYAAATVGGGGTLDLRNATSYNSDVREVKVTGRLVAQGNQLVAVIENENKRKGLTT